MKRFIILSWAILCSLISAQAATWTDSNGTVWSFTTSGNTASIYNNNMVAISGTIPADLTIPSKVYIGETEYLVTSIGYHAFYGCSSLTSITIPNSVTSIGKVAFGACSGLTDIKIPNSVTSIGMCAFDACSGLTRVNIEDIASWCNIHFELLGETSNPLYYAHHLFLNGTEITELTIPNSVTSIGNGAFSDCTSLTSVTIPNSVTSIGVYAFQRCSGLTSVTIPNSVTSIGYGAFSDCTSLTSVTIPNSVTSIGGYAFQRCSGLTSVTIPNSGTSIGESAFEGCSGLTSVNIEDIASWCNISFANYSSNPLSYAHHLFLNGTEITELNIPNSITSIGSYSFFGCSGLTSVTIPNGVTSIGDGAFYNCSGLTSVTIPNGVTSIGDGAFYNCSGLTSVTIPNSVTSIGPSVFFGCSGLTYVTIPNSVTSIGSYAFSGCSGLTSVNIGNSVTSIGNEAFYNCSSLKSVTIPESVTSVGSSAFYCNYIHLTSTTPLSNYPWISSSILFVPYVSLDAYREAWGNYNLIVAEEYSDYNINVTAKESESDVINIIGEEHAEHVIRLKLNGTFNGYDIMVFRNKMTNLRELDLSEAHVVGNPYKYYDNYYSKDNIITGYFAPTNIRVLKLPQGITALEGYAFSNCSKLQTLALPDGITTIPNNAFNNCSNLTSITIPESVESIGDNAFAGCSQLSNVQLPKELKQINVYAFWNCDKLTELHLPPYLESIGNNAYSYCDNLKSYYAYMPDIIPIGTNTFSNYSTATLYIPEFLYKTYYYDTNWSQFAHIVTTSLSPDDYLKVPTNSDIVFEDGDERIPDTSEGEHVDGELKPEGSFTVEGNEPQPFDEVEQNIDGEQGGSLIGEDDGEHQGNLTVNTLKVKIRVQANRWYFFCFPYNVTIANCTYPGQYAWRKYNGAARALGNSGWQNVTDATLSANQGYAFQSSATGDLIVSFNHPTFGGNRLQELVAYVCENAANASWNLVGNPYSCFYDFDASDFASPITVWNGSSYEAYRPGDDDCHLQPYQAYFVQKPDNDDNIHYNASHRETYRQSQAKKANQAKARKAKGINPARLLVNLTIGNEENEAIDRTRLVLNDKASRSYELSCDAAKFMSDNAAAQLYMMESNQPMAINERPFAGDIRLGYTAQQAGTLRISAPRMDIPMMLVDTKTGLTFDLSIGSYEFTTEAGTHNDRFMLRLSGEATSIRTLTQQTGVAIGLQDGGLSIGGAEGKTVEVYTTGGVQAAQHSGNGFVSLPAGVYVVKVEGKSAKLFVK